MLTATSHFSFRGYLALLFFLVMPALVYLMITAIAIEPMDGPLTRLGGYAERDYGWAGKQRTLNIQDASVKRYLRPAQVLVIGDSFSKPGLWQGYLRQSTGLDMVTLDLGKTSFEDLLASPVFKKYPPKIVVIETVEVFFLSKFRTASPTCQATISKVIPQTLPLQPETVPFQDRERSTRISLDDLNLKYAFVYLERSLQRGLFGEDSSQVAQFKMKRPDLFSNRRSDRLLVFRPDLDKSSWRDADIKAAICELRDLQRRFQANGQTHFVFIPIPDKSTAYADQVEGGSQLLASNLTARLIEEGIQSPRLDLDLKQAIALGERDVFLPNETHFGTRGYQIMAQTLSSYLQTLGALEKTAYQ